MSGTASSLAVIASPFLLSYILPKVISVVQSYIAPPPAGTRSQPRRPILSSAPPQPARIAYLRLLLLSLGLSLSLFTALLPPQNIFLSLSPPQSFAQRAFPILRTPLDIRIPTTELTARWTRQSGRELADEQLALLRRLQTLDARVAYAGYGVGPLTSCSWCRSPSGEDADGDYATDFALHNLPSVALSYLALLACVGILAGGGRKRWRKSAVYAIAGAVVVEVWMRLSWQGTRGGGQVVMLHAQMHVIRHIFFAFLTLAMYLLPATYTPPSTSSNAIIAPALNSISQQSEAALTRLRAAYVERITVMANKPTRNKVRFFNRIAEEELTPAWKTMAYWEGHEREGDIARADPAVREAREKLAGPWRTAPQEGKSMRQWLDEAMVLTPRQPLQESSAAT